MGKGEERLKGFRVRCSVKIEAPDLTEDEVLAHEKAIADAIKKNEVLQNVLAAIGTAGKIAIKFLAMSLLCGVLLLGCTAAPPAVQAAHSDATKAIVHYDRNVASIVAQLLKAYKDEATTRLNENYDDAVAENTDQAGKILVAKIEELLATKKAAEARIDGAVAGAQKQYDAARLEALNAIRLEAAVQRWMARKAVSAEDLQALIDLAMTLAELASKR